MSDIQYSSLIRERRSVRTFDGQGISSEIMEQLKIFADSCSNPYGIPMEFRFLNAKEHGLKSPVIAGTDDYIAVKLKRVPHFEEALGYAMEQFVLSAWSIGIGTTWIGGTMDRPAFERAMDLAEDEVMPCVSPIGYMAKRMSIKETVMRKGVGADRRKAFEELFYRDTFDQPMKEEEAERLRLPLQMVRLGPSAVNKQPWRVVVIDKDVHFYIVKGKGFENSKAGNMQRIDMGIALCHFALGAKEAGLAAEFMINDPGIAVPENTEYIASYRII
ncbi:MAG: nitroreductase [Clostridiales bacterium]|nr:nitroreductase [Clostridiales bacterium]